MAKQTLSRTQLGKYLRESRRRLGTTQREVANRLGITRQAYGNWESGRFKPHDDLRKLVTAVPTLDYEILATLVDHDNLPTCLSFLPHQKPTQLQADLDLLDAYYLRIRLNYINSDSARIGIRSTLEALMKAAD